MGAFRFDLTAEPVNREQIELVARHPRATPSGAKQKRIVGVTRHPTAYAEDRFGTHVRADLPALARHLKSQGLKRTWEVELYLEYAVPEDA
jgi:hypothetical protein